MAKYEIVSRAFGPVSPGGEHQILEPGAIVFMDDDTVPGPQHKALDAAAEVAKTLAGPQVMDFTQFQPMGSAATDEDVLADRIAAAFAKAGMGGVVAKPDDKALKAAEKRIADLEAQLAAVVVQPPATTPPPPPPPPPPKK